MSFRYLIMFKIIRQIIKEIAEDFNHNVKLRMAIQREKKRQEINYIQQVLEGKK